MTKEGTTLNCDYTPVVKDAVKEHGFGHRHVQVLAAFGVVFVSYMMRINMSVGIIAITDKTTNMTDVIIYDWDKPIQDMVLSSFFWGYMWLQVPAGQLAQRYGPKVLYSTALCINAAVSVLLPFFINLGGWQLACVLRALQGVTQGCLLPCIPVIISKWSPVNERSRIGNFMLNAPAFGSIIGMPLVGYLASRHGWPASFYAVGAVGFIMAAIWLLLARDSPAQHSSISQQEKDYIQQSTGQTGRQTLKTPWRHIFTSSPFWMLMVAQVGGYWGFVLLLLEIPSYLKMALRINTRQSGIYSALPYITMWLMGMVISYFIDMIIVRKTLTMSRARKLANSIGAVGMCGGLTALCFIPTSEVYLCIAVLSLSVGLSSGLNCGVFITCVELSPNFAGVLMGIINSVSNGIAILAPISVGYILKDPTNMSQWRTVFFMTAAISFASNAVFCLFCTIEKQPWNEPESAYDTELNKIDQDDEKRESLKL